jgi:hypothetical protein
MQPGDCRWNQPTSSINRLLNCNPVSLWVHLTHVGQMQSGDLGWIEYPRLLVGSTIANPRMLDTEGTLQVSCFLVLVI